MSGQNPPANPQSPGPGSSWGASAPPPSARGSGRELVGLLLLAAAATFMLGSFVNALGYGTVRVSMESAAGIFLGYPDILIALAVVAGIGRRPGPNAKALGIAALVLLAISVVFGVLLGLPGVLLRPGASSALGGLIEYLGMLAIALAAILVVREVLTGVEGVPVFGSGPATGAAAAPTYGVPTGPYPQQQSPTLPPQGQSAPPQAPQGRPEPQQGGSHPFSRPPGEGPDAPGPEQGGQAGGDRGA